MLFIASIVYSLYANFVPHPLNYRLELKEYLDQENLSPEGIDEVVASVLPYIQEDDVEKLKDVLENTTEEQFITEKNTYKTYYFAQLYYYKTTDKKVRETLFLSEQVVKGNISRLTAMYGKENPVNVLSELFTHWGTSLDIQAERSTLKTITRIYSQEVIQKALTQSEASIQLVEYFEQANEQ